jgi:hypothetical protein
MLEQRFEPNRKIGFRGFIALQKTDTFDTWKERTSIAVRSSVINNGASTPIGYVDAGWIPDANLIPYWQAILKAREKQD